MWNLINDYTVTFRNNRMYFIFFRFRLAEIG